MREKCALDRNRTCDLRYRKPTLYPLSYEGAAAVAAKGNENEHSRYRALEVKSVLAGPFSSGHYHLHGNHLLPESPEVPGNVGAMVNT